MTQPIINIPVLDSNQASQWDRQSIASGIPSRVLMENAGRAVSEAVLRLDFPGGVLVAAGHGNNGGDGWVAARYLARAGRPVAVAEYDRERSPDCEANRKLALREGIPVAEPRDWDRAGVIVDALLGTGASGALRGPVAAVSRQIVEQLKPVVAVDGPTGLDLTTGEHHSEIEAICTVTFGGLRRGHLLRRDLCGTVYVVDIGFDLGKRDPQWPVLVDRTTASSLRPSMGANSHKGTRGKVLVIGAADGMAGALHHAGRGAFAAGAGLVRMVASANSAAALQEQFPDATVEVSRLGPDVEDVVLEALDWCDSLAIGPGLGRGDDRTAFVRTLLSKTTRPVVMDADALHCGVDVCVEGSGPRILTPHAGEFAAMFPDYELSDRFAAPSDVLELLKSGDDRFTLLLKGVPTVIAGAASEVRVVATGNPGLATGGSGDVLSGLIAALLARRTTPLHATSLGAYMLGRAAEIAAESTSVAALRPGAVVDAMSDVWRELEKTDSGWPVIARLDPPAVT